MQHSEQIEDRPLYTTIGRYTLLYASTKQLCMW